MSAKKRFQARVVAGRYTLPAALLIVFACRLLAQAVLPVQGRPAGEGSLWAGYVSLPPALAYWGGFLAQALAGCLLIVLNNAFALIRIRASFQTAVWFALLASFPPALYALHAGDAAALAFVCALYFLFGSYRHPSAPSFLFAAATCWGVGCLAVPQLVFFLPFLWIGAWMFQSLSLRGFLATLLGWALPYWFLLGHAYWHGQMDLFLAPFRDMARVAPPFRGFDAPMAGMLGYLFVLWAVAAGRFFAKGYEDKIRTRNYLRFLVWMALAFFFYAVLQPPYGALLMPLSAACVSVLAGHLFVLGHGRMANAFFILALAGVFALYLWNVWRLS